MKHRNSVATVIVLLFFTVLSAGCANVSTGNDSISNTTAVESIVNGKTTKKDISQLFGEPTGVEKRSNGVVVWTYINQSVKSSLFSSKGAVRELSVTFDSRGVVTDHSYSNQKIN